MPYKVFISFKNLDSSGRPTRDSKIAAQLYQKLRARGIETFFSNEEVQRKSRPDYGKLIDEALESSVILFLVATRSEYVESRWVRYEWECFRNEINSARKNGYIIPVVEGMSVGELPFGLRHGQVYTSAQLDQAVDMVAGVLGVSGAAPRSVNTQENRMSAAEMNELGNDYYYGINGKKLNYTEAVKWFREAAEQGHAPAQYSLGKRYENGKGVPKDRSEAVKWYRKAAEQGYAPAQYSLGWCYENGIGVSKDLIEAVKWHLKAAEQGDAPAQWNLGICYENGKGVPKDLCEATKWYRKAAGQGHSLAKTALERLA